MQLKQMTRFQRGCPVQPVVDPRDSDKTERLAVRRPDRRISRIERFQFFTRSELYFFDESSTKTAAGGGMGEGRMVVDHGTIRRDTWSISSWTGGN